MSTIERVEVLRVDLAPMVPRSDAIQSFVEQETPIVRVVCDDGSAGTGYSYTIGTGGSSVVALIADHLAPRLIGRDADEIESIWKDLFFATHATAVGALVIGFGVWTIAAATLMGHAGVEGHTAHSSVQITTPIDLTRGR